MNLGTSLDLLAETGAYPGANNTKVRWGQLIRSSANLAKEGNRLVKSGSLVSLDLHWNE